jgi:hypothetical protein
MKPISKKHLFRPRVYKSQEGDGYTLEYTDKDDYLVTKTIPMSITNHAQMVLWYGRFCKENHMGRPERLKWMI